MRIYVFCSLLFLGLNNKMLGQESMTNPIIDDYHLATQLYESQSYERAFHLFLKINEAVDDKHDMLSIKSAYYMARSAMYLYTYDAHVLMEDFVMKYPDSYLSHESYRNIGDYYYQKRDYENAYSYYKLVNINHIENTNKNEFKYKIAYSLFELEQYQESASYFSNLKDVVSPHQHWAKYYFAYIAYLNQNFVTAKAYFLELLNEGFNDPTIPLFITQIYHKLEAYDKLVEFALPFSDSSAVDIRINKLIAEAYYHNGDYNSAIVFFDDKYLKNGGYLSDLGYYLLGQSYYRVNQFSLASSAFNKIVSSEDSLAQNAYYYLADSYLELGDKRSAQNAFESAALIGGNSRITEHANFNFAKLCYELGYPYADPTMILQDFINEFPDSEYTEEAYSYLVNAFLSHKDYSRAIVSMESSGLENITLQQAYQEISYYRAVQLFNDGDYEGSKDYFDKALIHTHNRNYESLTWYWIAENYYRLGDYNNSIEAFTSFQKTPFASSMDSYVSSYYNMAYSYYKLFDFTNAIKAFESFIGNANESDHRLHDAFARLGDAFFMIKNYDKAVINYQSAVDSWGVDSDYSSYQIALAYYQKGNYEFVVEHLQNFANQFPKSIYNDDAYYRMGQAYVKLSDSDQAIDMFNNVVVNHPKSVFVPDARMKIALILFNSGNNQESILAFKDIVSDYPSTVTAREAINNARSVFVDIGDVKAYADWVQTLSFVSLSNSQLDSTAYESAELQFLRADHNKAYLGFKEYINQYDDGIFKLISHYYFAISASKIDSIDDAIKAYEYVCSAQHNSFTIDALKSVADIYTMKRSYKKAIDAYIQLDDNAETIEDQLIAKQGLMLCYFELSDYQKAIEQAQIVLNSGRVDKSLLLEVKIFIARSAYRDMDIDLAASMYKEINVESQGELKAEAMYHLAFIAFYEGEYEKSKQIIFEQSRLLPMYKLWLGKSFIVLAKNYLQDDDVFQASHTLDQLILNIQDRDILKEAKSLRAQILSESNSQLHLNLDSLTIIDSIQTK